MIFLTIQLLLMMVTSKYEITREETLKYFKPKNPLFKKYHQINKNISRDDITYN